MKIQYWRNGVFMGLITHEEADEILNNLEQLRREGKEIEIADYREIGYISVTIGGE